MNTMTDKLKNFVVETFLFGDGDNLTESTSFLEEGIIDSTGILELMEFVESEFSISISDEEMLPENMDSIESLVAFIQKKQLN